MGIKLEQARHPCVELQDNVEYIPNDIQLVYGESSFMILTGPNVSTLSLFCKGRLIHYAHEIFLSRPKMGGKSTYIRALGACVLLAQCGCFVPCAKARINLCYHLLARVGAGDLPDRGISTFMAEMIEAA